jgi:hypothetical protein
VEVFAQRGQKPGADCLDRIAAGQNRGDGEAAVGVGVDAGDDGEIGAEQLHLGVNLRHTGRVAHHTRYRAEDDSAGPAAAEGNEQGENNEMEPACHHKSG